MGEIDDQDDIGAGRRTAPSAATVERLIAEYNAAREAGIAAARAAGLPEHDQSSPFGWDHGAAVRAYQPLKRRNELCSLLNRALRRSFIQSMPVEIQLNNIGFCNLRCPQCPTHGTDATHAEFQSKSYTMARSVIEAIAAETMPYAVKVSTSGLGEGLIHKDFDAIVAGAARFGVRVFTNSNGTTLIPKKIGYLFGITELRLSLDAAAPVSFEALRKGAKYGRVMRNVLALARANTGLPPSLQIIPSVNFGVCASNARDIPLMVDLCIHLGLPAIYGFRIEPLNPAFADDDIQKFPAYYKHYYLQAQQRARGRQIILSLPAPAPDVDPDPNAGPGDAGMVVSGLDDSYYQRLPSFDKLIDATDIDADARAIMVEALEAGIGRHAAVNAEGIAQTSAHAQELDRALEQRLNFAIASLPPEELARLRGMHASERLVADCGFLQRFVTYAADGNVHPCCRNDIAPIGRVPDRSTEAIFSGGEMLVLTNEFRVRNLRPVCQQCVYSTTSQERQIFPARIG